MIIDFGASNRKQHDSLREGAELRKLEDSRGKIRRKIEALLAAEGLTLEDILDKPRNPHRQAATNNRKGQRPRRKSV